MKTLFWTFVILVIIGAAMAGYSSGHYDGVRRTRIETQIFLQDFTRSTEMETYLQQHGYSDWLGRLRVYGFVGPTSYIRSYGVSVYAVSAGVACVAVGLVGLLFMSRGRNKKPVVELSPRQP
jgi:hypothetical protein